MKNIYLIGFMGTGKTAVGKLLSDLLKLEFVDLDALIEKEQGITISEIFTDKGEAYFRELEAAVLKGVARKNDLVVSCGGGIVINPGNISLMKKSGFCVCLFASIKTILSRTAGQSHRPLLNVAHPEQAIEELLKARAPFYAQADLSIDTSSITVLEAANMIIQYINDRTSGVDNSEFYIR